MPPQDQDPWASGYKEYASGSSYSGPQDLNESKFLRDLYHINKSVQGKVSQLNDGDLIKATLEQIAPDQAEAHEENLRQGGRGANPSVVLKYVEEKTSPDPAYSGPADQPNDPIEESPLGSESGSDDRPQTKNGNVYDPDASVEEGDFVQIDPDSLYDQFDNPGKVIHRDYDHGGHAAVQFPVGHTEMMDDAHFVKLADQNRTLQLPTAENDIGEQEEEYDTPGQWSWEKDYVYSELQGIYFFHLSDYEGAPYAISEDKLRTMVQHYSKHHGTRAWKLDEVAAEAGIPADAWREIKQKMNITHDSPPYLPEDFEKTDDVKGMAVEAVQTKKHQWKEEFQRENLKELRKDAEKWRKLDSVLDQATDKIEDWAADYDPPQLHVSVKEQPPEEGVLVANLQDAHIGLRPAEGADNFSVSRYCDRLFEAFTTGLERAARNVRLRRVYVVVGGDLIHADTYRETTTAGTEQEMAVSTSTAFSKAVNLAVRQIDAARQIADEVRFVCPSGNHDKVLGKCAAEAVAQRFYGADDVIDIGRDERIYEKAGHHLLVFTHGDYAKKEMRRIGDKITAEARKLQGQTRDDILFTGHLHHKAMDIVDESGRLHLQAPTPSPDDQWADGELLIGPRKQLQLYSTRLNSQDDETFGVEL